LVTKIESKSATGRVFFTILYEYSGTKITKYSLFDNQQNTNVLYDQYIYQYQGDNLVKTTYTGYDRTTGKIVSQSTTTSEFDSNGNNIKQTIIRTNTDISKGTSRTYESMFTYEYNGKLVVKEIPFSKDKTTGNFVSSGFRTYKYDAMGNRIEYNFYNADAKLYYVQTSTYNAFNKLLTIKETQNGVTSLLELHEYDAKGNETLMIYFADKDVKAEETITSYEYDAKGNITKQTTTRKDYYDPNLGDYTPTPFTNITTVQTMEYSCPK
jgi:hypothetical protein